MDLGIESDGEFGVRHVMKSLLADFDILMNVAGYNSIKEIDRNALSTCPLRDYLTIEFILGAVRILKLNFKQC